MTWIGQLLNGRDEYIPPGVSLSPRQATIPLTPARAPVPLASKYEPGGFISMPPIQHDESPTEHSSPRIPAPPSPHTNPQQLLPLIMPNHPIWPNMLTCSASHGQPLAFRPATSASTRSTISGLSTFTWRDSLISSPASTAASTVASTVLDYDYNYELPCDCDKAPFGDSITGESECAISAIITGTKCRKILHGLGRAWFLRNRTSRHDGKFCTVCVSVSQK
jgi:hypothetical protein